MTVIIYNGAKAAFANGDIDWESDSIRVLLLDDAGNYTADPDHDFVEDLDDAAPGDNELAGTGYQRLVLAGRSVTQNNAENRAELAANNPVWEGLNAGTAAAIVVFQHNTNDEDSRLIMYDDTNFPFVSNGGDFTFQFDGQEASGDVIRFQTPAS